MTLLSGDTEALRAAMTGPVIGPDDPDYDDARSVFNADVDRRPKLIARCDSPADVSAAIDFARREGLEITVRGGAHSFSGAAVSDGGVMIDLTRLNQVIVDPASRRARVGGGALLADLDAAAQAHGLATPAGQVSHTGVGGLTLGGGMGWLSRKFGLAIDNLVAVEIVTADGQLHRAAADEHPDLFWAVRGGGGNFGVVTSFEFALHEVGPAVHIGLFFWGLEQGGDALRLARDVTADMPRELNAQIVGLSAPPAPFVPEQYHHQPGYALLVAGFGEPEEHAALCERVRAGLPPLFEFVTPMPYTALQQLMDDAAAWGYYVYEKGLQLAELSDEAIDVVTEHFPQRNSPLSLMAFSRLDGAYSEVGEDDTAFGGTRAPQYSVTIGGLCPTPEMLPAERDWVRSFWDALVPHAVDAGGYINVMADHEHDRIRTAFGHKYDRLARIKAVYDPDNVFHHNANITPAGVLARTDSSPYELRRGTVDWR